MAGYHSLQGACQSGNLREAQRVVEKFGLTAEDVRCNGNFVFRLACEDGHLAVAQWLVAGFGLTAEDCRPGLEAARRGGQTGVVQWLASTFPALALALAQQQLL